MVARQGADSDAQLVAPLGQVVEVSDPVRQFDRVVIGQQVAKRPQTDSPGALQALSNQQVGRRARLPRRREVLTDPRLVESEVVEPLELFEVPTLAVADGPFGRVRRHEECTQSHETPPTMASVDLAWGLAAAAPPCRSHPFVKRTNSSVNHFPDCFVASAGVQSGAQPRPQAPVPKLSSPECWVNSTRILSLGRPSVSLQASTSASANFNRCSGGRPLRMSQEMQTVGSGSPARQCHTPPSPSSRNATLTMSGVVCMMRAY